VLSGELLREKQKRYICMLPSSLESLKIVVVDDDPMIRTVVGRCLTHFGASVTLCEEAAGGMRAIEQVRPDAVLLDLIMPGQDGFYLLDRINALGHTRNWRPKVVVITGLRDPNLELELKQSGAGYLAKPFTPVNLFRAVHEASQSLSLSEKQLECVSNPV
jgi:CheY-like chemotaxis protein